MISRRNFVKSTGILPLFGMGDIYSGIPNTVSAKMDKAPLIKSISIRQVTGNFNRFISMNAYDTASKGIEGTQTLVILKLADGTEGIGGIGYLKPDKTVYDRIKDLIGRDPFSFYSWESDRIICVAETMHAYFFDPNYSWIESAVLDAIGKLKNKPVWQLMGDSLKEAIDPYDGTLYFEDIASQTDVRKIAEIAKRIRAEGYRAIKIKLGRPFKWLPGEAGVNRDIEAFIALRETVGNNFLLMADANNGYKDHYNWALKLLKATIPYDMFFIEELFPDNALMYAQMRRELLEAGLFVRIAEGEDIRNLLAFEQYMEDLVYNFIQPDMLTCGFSNILCTAKKAIKFPHVNLIPHVWQSQFGLIMSLHLSKIQRNIPFVEDARYFDHSIDSSAYLFKEGQWYIPHKPGWGLELVPGYDQSCCQNEIVIS